MKLKLEKTRASLGSIICVAMTVIAIALLASCDSEAEADRLPKKTVPTSNDVKVGKEPSGKSPVSLNWLIELQENLLSTDPEILSKALEDLRANESEIEEFAASHYEKLSKNSGEPYENQGSDQNNSYRYNMLLLLILIDGQRSKSIFVNVLENPKRDPVATNHGITYAGRVKDESIKALARKVCNSTADSILLETCRNYGFDR